MRTFRSWTAAVVLLGGLAACGDGSSEDPADRGALEQPPDQETTQETAVDADDMLVASQGTVPHEPANEFADIATTGPDAEAAWQRFRLSGGVPETDLDTHALLFVAFGESGSCPARLDDVVTGEDEVRVVIGIEADRSEEGDHVCTDDYNPRAFVLAVPRDELPDDAFELVLRDPWGHTRTFQLSTVPLSEPPRGAAIVASLTREATAFEFAAEPSSVSVGGPVEMVLTNEGEVGALNDAFPVVLSRWNEQRWLPIAEQPAWEEGQTAIVIEPVEVGPGQSEPVATVDTGQLRPGWYGLSVKLQLRGAGGTVEVESAFEVVASP